MGDVLEEDPGDDRWDKLRSWHHVKEKIVNRLENAESQDWNITLNHGPQAFHTLRHSNSLYCMTHFSSSSGEMFISHYSIGSTNQISVWSMDVQEHTAPCQHVRFSTESEIHTMLYVPKHRVYITFCADLVMRLFTDARSQCQEISAAVCSTTILCLTYNTELDELYAGGIGTLQKWKVKGSEHAAVLIQDKSFHTEIARDQWVRDIKINFANKQLLALCDRSIYLVSYQTGKRAHHLKRDRNSTFKCCCFYKQREYFVTGGGDGLVIVWNAVMFTQVHTFYGHRSAISALQVHEEDPFLFSSSLDGSVRIWRMDNFQKFLRVDLGEPVFKMKLLSNMEFFCQTEKEIKIYDLNQFFSLFAAVESTIWRLQLCRGQGKINRVLASTEDGSLRFFSPVTGSTLTIIYPMPSFQILSCFAYHRETERLLTVLDGGEVLVFNCADNPCVAEELWEPLHSDEKVCNLLSIDVCYTVNHQEVCENVVFSGLKNGQIFLLCSMKCKMEHAVQAHVGEIVCLESCVNIDRSRDRLEPTTDVIVSGGTDNNLNFWRIVISVRRRGKIVIYLVPILKINCLSPPKQISMFENLTCIAVEAEKKHKILLLELFMSEESATLEYRIHTHDDDEDHTQQITTLDNCPLLGLFASSSLDGYIKLWNRSNILIRELNFDTPVRGMCFANDRGDLLVGYQSHVCSVNVSSYLPLELLEQIVLLDFEDDYREIPIPYNHTLKPLFNFQDLNRYTVSPEKGFNKKSEQSSTVEVEESELDLYLQSFAKALLADRKASILFPGRTVIGLPGIEKCIAVTRNVDHPSTENSSTRIADKILSSRSGHLYVPSYEQAWSSTSFADNTEEVIEKSFLRCDESSDRISSLNLSVPSLQLEDLQTTSRTDSKPESEMKEKPQYDPYGLTELEKKLLDKDPIIAPDGYIPNSVIRSKIGKKVEALPPVKKELWTPRPLPHTVPSHLPPWWGELKTEFDDAMSESPQPWTWGDDDDEKRVTPTSPNKQLSSSSLRSPSPIKGVRKLQPMPKSGKVELLSAKMKLHKAEKIDLEFEGPTGKRKKIEPRSREKSRPSFKLTNMVVDENSTDVHLKNLQEDEPKKKKLPSIDLDLLQRLMEEPWFPELESESWSFELMMQRLLELLDNIDANIRGSVCDYIIEIQREIGIPTIFLDPMIDKLLTQVNHPNPTIRRISVRTIRALGIDKQDLLLLLPKLIDSDSDVRLETELMLHELTGVREKEQLSGLMESLGIMKTHDGTADEEQAIRNLAERQRTGSESPGNIQHWINSSSPTANTVTNVKLEDVEKQWLGRAFQKTSDSMGVSERSSRASEKLHDASFSSGKQRPNNWTPVSPAERLKLKTPFMRDISDDRTMNEYMKKHLEALQETNSVSGQSAASDKPSRLHPTQAAMYRYYEDQSLLTKSTINEAASEEEMGSMKKGQADSFEVDKRSQIDSSDVDSDIHSMSAIPSSQVTDIATDSMSTHDSGIGRDMTYSDSVSLRKQRTRSFREKSLKDRGQPTLSPVKSAQEINIQVPQNWRQFFNTPTAQERRRMELVKREFSQGKMSRHSCIPPISYISDDVPLLPAEEGLRLLHTVRVGEKISEEPEERHQIQPIPGRLSMHTQNEDTGLSNFGIIQMQWTTGVPGVVSKETPEESSRLPTKSTIKSNDTSLYLPQLHHLKKTRESQIQSSHLDEEFTLPIIDSTTVKSPDFQWQKPLPPPPAKESRTSIPHIRHEHHKYCHYYTLAKKKMHLFTSSVRDLSHLPEMVIQQALQAKSSRRSRKRGAPSRISRNESIMLPPISLRQLIRV